VQIIDVGAGEFQISWNGGAVHSFSGVAQIEVKAV
jgi:hypothetical protein